MDDSQYLALLWLFALFARDVVPAERRRFWNGLSILFLGLAIGDFILGLMDKGGLF